MGQDVSCGQCAPESHEVFDPSPYVDSPSVTREDVLQLKVAFDYLSPRHGRVSINAHTGRDVGYLREMLKETEKDLNEMTFDDLYRVMKQRIAEGKRGSQAIMENSAMNASCIVCPYAKRVDQNEKAGN